MPKPNRTVNRDTLKARAQEHVDRLQGSLEEMGLRRYPQSPMMHVAIQAGDKTMLIGAGIGMQIQALARMTESFGIWLRLESEPAATNTVEVTTHA